MNGKLKIVFLLTLLSSEKAILCNPSKCSQTCRAIVRSKDLSKNGTLLLKSKNIFTLPQATMSVLKDSLDIGQLAAPISQQFSGFNCRAILLTSDIYNHRPFQYSWPKVFLSNCSFDIKFI